MGVPFADLLVLDERCRLESIDSTDTFPALLGEDTTWIF